MCIYILIQRFKGEYKSRDISVEFSRLKVYSYQDNICTIYTYNYCSCDSIDNSSCLILISQHMVWLAVSCLCDLMISQLSYCLSTMNCNTNEEERRNREISRNIDRQIKIEKSKRENVRLALNTV